MGDQTVSAQHQEDATTGFGWRRFQTIGSILALLGFVGFIIFQGFNPFVLVPAVLLLVGFILMSRQGRVGVIWLGVVGLLMLALEGAFIIPALQRLESTLEFILTAVIVMGLVMMVVGAIPAFRQGKGKDRPAPLARAIFIFYLVVLVAASGVSIAKGLDVKDEAAQPGEIELVAHDFEFKPKTLEAASGEVAVHIFNKDTTTHTFTIDALGVDVVLPPNKQRRVTFKADPGAIKFYCKPHSPDMKGTMIVS